MEATNFFRQISQMEMNSKLMLTITKATESTIIVSILVENDSCGDKAKNLIPPFNLKGTPEELDEGFFAHIKQPVRTATGLLSNLENFMKQVELAQANSAMEKEKSTKEQKDKDSKNRKYSEAMLKADALVKEGKYKEAWTALPKVGDYPEHSEEIKKKQEICERQFAPSLFSDDAQETAEITEITQDE
ncbi:PRTRC system protein E [Sphingobacterium athyrii]|uniref:Prtrc system protein e n=1 Tax=Sphingobacterium athyrii TaxID=2152717 RepID=A0A363NUD5_9SPHI|nr:PRTRC system protein E [Sphingobacterium athyrii]PUV24389.1 prtrc system protein e [Sphingobacterium athyrii]